MGSLEFAAKSELPRCEDKAQDGVYAKSGHVGLMGFIIARSSLAFNVNIFATVFCFRFLAMRYLCCSTTPLES